MSDQYRLRNLELEEQLLEHAAHGVADHSALQLHAHTRSMRCAEEYVTNPMLVLLGRNYLRESMAELADVVNYLRWRAEELQGVDDEAAAEAVEELRLVVVLYERMRKAVLQEDPPLLPA